MRGNPNYLFPTILAIILLWLLLVPSKINKSFFIFNKTEIILISVLLLLCYTVLKKNKITFDDPSFVLLATLYVAKGFFYFLVTRNSDDGLATILYVLFIVWSTDTES